MGRNSLVIAVMGKIKKNVQGFTLVELVVVLAIIAVLALLVVGAIIVAREASKLAEGRAISHSVESGMKDSTIFSWKFDDNTSTTAKDDWDNNNFTVPSTCWEGGIEGSACKFTSGTSKTFSPSLGQLATVSFWFKLPNTTDLSGTIAALRPNPTTGTGDNIVLSNGILSSNICSPIKNMTDPSFVVNDTKWHQVVLSRSTDTKLCLDGKCKNFGDTSSNLYNVGYVIFNGGTGCGQVNFSQGVIIDEFSTYSKAF